MNRASVLLAAVLASLGMLFAGCGGDESDTVLLNEKTFVQRAASICERAEKEAFEGAVQYAKGKPAFKEEMVVEPVLIPVLGRQVERLKDIGLPQGNEAAIDAMIEEYERALEETGQNPASILQPSNNPFEKYNRMAKENGLIACSHVP